MATDDFTITLSHDQALVLSDWLYRMIGTPGFDGFLEADRAVWSPIYQISGTLETTLAEVFAPDYLTRLEEARERLLDVESHDTCVGTPAS